MPVDLKPLAQANRLLFDVPLQPLMGSTFQPTGFPDLGSATFLDGGGTPCVLVESAQSMANRLENTIWDPAADALVDDADGLSYVRVKQEGEYLTSSITEAHRVNSPYILEGSDKTFFETLKDAFGVMEKGPVNRKLLAETLLKYDVNALIHGVFLAKKDLAGGRLRVARALSALVEARAVNVVASGGVKNDHVDPSGEASKGFGNVPFSREEFTASEITASFCLDLQQLRAYGLGEKAERLLIILSLYKIRALLSGSLRFRTRCDLEVKGSEAIQARRPEGFVLPELDALAADLKTAIADCGDLMQVAEVTYKA